MLPRLLTCGVLAIVSIGHAAASTSPPVVEITIFADGSLQIEGKKYSTQPAIDAEVSHLKQRKPAPEIRIVMDRKVSFDAVAKALVELQGGGKSGAKKGVVKIGIVNTQQ